MKQIVIGKINGVAVTIDQLRDVCKAIKEAKVLPKEIKPYKAPQPTPIHNKGTAPIKKTEIKKSNEPTLF